MDKLIYQNIRKPGQIKTLKCIIRDVWAVDQTARYYAIKNLTPRSFSRVDFGVEVTCQKDDPANNETKLTFFEELPAFGTVKVQLSSTWCTGGHASMKIWLINMVLEK